MPVSHDMSLVDPVLLVRVLHRCILTQQPTFDDLQVVPPRVIYDPG